MTNLVHEFIFHAASASPDAEALVYQGHRLGYAGLATQVDAMAQLLLELRINAGERVAIYLEKRFEAVVGMFGAAAAGAVFVPVNPLLKSAQVAHILADCNVKILITTTDRLAALADVMQQSRDLHTVIIVGSGAALPNSSLLQGIDFVYWDEVCHKLRSLARHRRIDSDMAAILYTSGSTGRAKGVVLSHRNMVAGAVSVAGYLGNTAQDRILAALPLSFDYGLSQLTTAFYAGASVVLMNYLFPPDIVRAVKTERITGLAAVPPLWHQLAQQDWGDASSLRYITNSGGALQRPTLDKMRAALPATQIYLMYGLTEAFRSTFLPPSEIATRPNSIGRAIPNAEVIVVRPDGTLCEPNEPGELVHRGALVAMGYWNNPEKTARHFKPAPGQDKALPFAEIAVWSGDTVRLDEEGFLYFIGRDDDMIKVSGYRVSPYEVEEVVYATGLVAEAAAIGVPHPQLGQAIIVVVPRADGMSSAQALLKGCQSRLPSYMVPAHVEEWADMLPRTPNGKIDRKFLQLSLASFFTDQVK
ncbi:acyl-CoA ligase (AMP-forming), exosortase A system-associated [Glaciimonas sp. CA11.2]|uniref:acyl-CoA ligase (AMP-forming), exosortase A system-associated n=1 Tax=Glaciimonas sp. CA11.2 TaxID=3048601 RepID=UPI002AB4604B|nr:acyl-CoA ligase (AMP-forming), exosortase A system-associated [Glaciimonas sp. CA11.2]MDY7544700.1 acyl-CoA ligase (AMP-forming), exosortase A system-associated [Glaciimonas sp. CA11.2]MEB0163383.1 acyl-CoA ligase (AMP-forming), exosortase A system-associated [Glaciimonas sp. CA11.2]